VQFERRTEVSTARCASSDPTVRGRESRPQGERPQVLGRPKVKVAAMASAETVLAVYADPGVGRQSTGKPDEIETTPVRFGEGVPEKCRDSGNSPPPYSTARPV
jgi:hypothetical protein